jgi:hypothetical protein
MQLHLETDELELIATILLQREGELSGSSQQNDPNARTGVDLKLCEELLDRVLERDTKFDFDELEQLAEILSGEKDAMNKLAAQAQSGPPDAAFQRKRAKLQHILEKLEEVCTMI